jgi:hypothetical protein
MRLGMGVGGNARAIGFIGRPVDEARVMLWDEDRPFGAWQLAGLPFAPPGRIERDLTPGFSVNIASGPYPAYFAKPATTRLGC